jgi:hypothetical protein
MPENMMNSAQKSNSKLFDQNYDLIFKQKPEIKCPEFKCAEYGCGECPVAKECKAYLNDKFDLSL